jgi:hypothetical protein
MALKNIKLIRSGRREAITIIPVSQILALLAVENRISCPCFDYRCNEFILGSGSVRIYGRAKQNYFQPENGKEAHLQFLT